MTQIIEIEGDLVRFVERTVNNTARLEDVMPLIEMRPPVSLFHPRTAIFTQWDESDPTNKRVTFLCELSPSTRSIVKSQRRYRLAMPWTYFIFGFSTSGTVTALDTVGRAWSLDDYRVFHSNERITGMTGTLWSAFLPNVYEDGRICFGSTGVSATLALPDRVDALVNTWYQSEFNNDVQGGRQHPLPFNAALPNGWIEWVNATNEHGASAWTRFPEWTSTDRNIAKTTVADALSRRINRLTEPMIFADMIPEIPVPATFGRIEEWVRSDTLTPASRLRLLAGLQHLAEENPQAIAVPDNAAAATPTTGAGADGGTPI